jgi:hypothetical protein
MFFMPYTRRIAVSAAAVAAALALSASPAFAGTPSEGVTGLVGGTVNTVTNAANGLLAHCPGQTFSQPFAALGDNNLYTLVPGSEFNNPPEGWELSGGAQVVATTLPDGSEGSALNLPSGSVAVSPPVCVTLKYPTARVYAQTAEGNASVGVSVSYPETKSELKPRQVGELESAQGSWELSAPFRVRPRLAGKEEGTRQVRFIFTAGGSGTSTLLYGLYVDPRMI